MIAGPPTSRSRTIRGIMMLPAVTIREEARAMKSDQGSRHGLRIPGLRSRRVPQIGAFENRPVWLKLYVDAHLEVTGADIEFRLAGRNLRQEICNFPARSAGFYGPGMVLPYTLTVICSRKSRVAPDGDGNAGFKLPITKASCGKVRSKNEVFCFQRFSSQKMQASSGG